MKKSTVATAIAYGAISGMRSMSGPTALGLRFKERRPHTRAGRVMNGRAAARLLPLLAAGEILFDKLPFTPDRTDALPLAGRALMGGIVGAVVAGEDRSSVWAGALIGAVAAIAVAHVAYQARKHADKHIPKGLSAIVEDSVVLGLGTAMR